MGKIIFLGLGSNLGDREGNLNKAIKMIKDLAGEVILFSGIYETEPWGFQTEDKFLNMVIGIRTSLKPHMLLKRLMTIEAHLGRSRNKEGYSSRTIDIDILLYGDLVIEKPDLVIPHPLIRERRFVLIPLCDIASDMIHPVYKKTFVALLRECKDDLKVNLYK